MCFRDCNRRDCKRSIAGFIFISLYVILQLYNSDCSVQIHRRCASICKGSQYLYITNHIIYTMSSLLKCAIFSSGCAPPMNDSSGAHLLEKEGRASTRSRIQFEVNLSTTAPHLNCEVWCGYYNNKVSSSCDHYLEED